jgi:hypothetical protein
MVDQPVIWADVTLANAAAAKSRRRCFMLDGL